MNNERRQNIADELRDIAWKLMCVSADIGALSPNERAELSNASYGVEAIYQKVRWNAEKQEIAA